MYRKRPGGLLKHMDFLLLDLLCFLGSIWLSFYIRLDTFQLWEREAYRIAFLLVALLHICAVMFRSSYKNILRRGYLQELAAVIEHAGLVLGAMVLFMFFLKAQEVLSRLIVGYSACLSVGSIFLVRSIWKAYLRNHIRGTDRRLLLVTDRSNAERILQQYEKRTIDFCVCGVILLDTAVDNKDPKDTIKEICGIPIVGRLSDMAAYFSDNVIDEVLFSIPQGTEIPEEQIRECRLMGLTVHFEYVLSEELLGANYHEELGGLTVLTSYTKEMTLPEAFAKRTLDIIGGIVGVCITVLITIFLGPAIYFADPGPIFFSQKRVGRNGRIFRIYKFRSMYQDAEKRKAELMAKNEMSGLMFKMEADPRVIGSGPDGTRHGLGHFIRATSLDEFPQFFNVLMGDMSLVGTRPPTVEEYEQYEAHHRARLAVKPGITGLWQVSGRSDITDFEEVVKLDTAYIQNWSFRGDIKILLKTVEVVLLRKGSR